MKVAIVHDWLASMRGGERCVEVFCELFPQADLFTLLHFQGKVSETIERMPIHTSFIQHLPFLKRYYRHYLPLFPFAIERFDMHDYDLILSSSHCVAKGVRRLPGTLHVSYTHTPMRYAWDLYDAYFEDSAGLVKSQILRTLMAHLRRWDVQACDRVDRFVANSHHVADRIRRHYGKESIVVYPPVDFDRFVPSETDDGFYLVVSALAPYKRVELAIEACNVTKRPLKIIGTGQQYQFLKQHAGPTVELLGWQPDKVITEYYRRCKALLFPGEEDFGIVPLEVMACGKPVIAYAKGGALETVVPLNPGERKKPTGNAFGMPHGDDSGKNPTGVFFYEQTCEALIQALEVFERYRDQFQPEMIRSHVEPFDRKHFKARIHAVIEQTWEEFQRTRSC